MRFCGDDTTGPKAQRLEDVQCAWASLWCPWWPGMWWEFPKELVKSSIVKDESGSREVCLLSSKMWPLCHRVMSPHSFSHVLIQERLFGSLLTLLLGWLPFHLVLKTHSPKLLFRSWSPRGHTLWVMSEIILLKHSLLGCEFGGGCIIGGVGERKGEGGNSVVVFWF